ncbi:MAG: DNA internalization-related competence protein ComEC/Rec2 [bacterium]
MFNTPSFKTFALISSGILIGKFFSVPLIVSIILFTISTLVLIFLIRKYIHTRFFQIFLFLSVTFCGICYFQTYNFISTHNPSFAIITVNTSSEIKGYLIKDPANKKTRLEYMLKVTHVIHEKETHKADFKILVKDYKKLSKNLKYGDQVTLKGKIKKPRGLRNPEGFNYRKYLTGKNIFYVFYVDRIIQKTEIKKGNIILREIVYPVRRFINASISELFTSTSTRSIIKALTLGDKELISDDIWESFSKTGVIHVLAVSGLHVGFILVMCLTLFNLFRFNKFMSTVLTIVILIFYTLLTESHPPVFRAAVMSSLYLLSIHLERKTQPFNIIGLAGLILIIINPNNLFSLSFILSFTAISSIIYFYNKLINLPFYVTIKKQKPFRAKLLATMFVSLSALMGTIPVSAYYFNRIPLLSIIINFFAIPLTGLIVGLSFITFLFSSISLFVASIYAGLVDILVSAFISIIIWFSHFSFSHITAASPDSMIIVIYYLVLFLVFNFNNKKYRKILIFSLLISFNILTWKAVLHNNSPKLQWIQFDVGQGDAALLTTPKNKTILIDGGAKSKLFDNGKQIIAQYLNKKGIKRINYIILSHPHSDHVGGLVYIVQNFTVDRIYYSNCPYSTSIYSAFLEIAKQKNYKLYEITSPDSLILPACKIYFLSPSENIKSETKKFNFNVNNQSLIAYVLYGQTKMLFMGDAEKEIEQKLLQTYGSLQCDALKIGHHGSSTSSTFPFIKQVDPEIGILSVGENNRFHLPSKLVLQYFHLLDIQIHRTDKQGAAVLVSDGITVSQIDWR